MIKANAAGMTPELGSDTVEYGQFDIGMIYYANVFLPIELIQPYPTYYQEQALAQLRTKEPSNWLIHEITDAREQIIPLLTPEFNAKMLDRERPVALAQLDPYEAMMLVFNIVSQYCYYDWMLLPTGHIKLGEKTVYSQKMLAHLAWITEQREKMIPTAFNRMREHYLRVDHDIAKRLALAIEKDDKSVHVLRNNRKRNRRGVNVMCMGFAGAFVTLFNAIKDEMILQDSRYRSILVLLSGGADHAWPIAAILGADGDLHITPIEATGSGIYTNRKASNVDALTHPFYSGTKRLAHFAICVPDEQVGTRLLGKTRHKRMFDAILANFTEESVTHSQSDILSGM